MKRVLVACEYSGIVRDAFIEAGHDAISVDFLPSESDRGPHYMGDVRDMLTSPRAFDLMVAHPPCTYLTNAANRWLYEKCSETTPEERLALRDEAIDFFKMLLRAPIEQIAIENPYPNPDVTLQVGRCDDFIRPYYFGDPYTKGICLWLRNLPPLMSTSIADKAKDHIHKMSPGPDRQKERSRFYPGVARAMAEQWGNV